MKKVIAVLLIAIVCLSAFASERHFGYGLSVSGNTKSQNDVSVSFVYRPFEFSYMNPFVRAEAGLKSSKAYVGLETVRSFWNPLDFATVNKSLYSPSVGAGLSLSYKDKAFRLYLEASPLRVIEKDFTTEYLAPAFEYSIKNHTYHITVYLFRFTALI